MYHGQGCGLRAAGRCRCARRAHYDSLRAAAKRRLLACTLAAAREEGALRPLLRITPAGRRSWLPATANKFVHILWKNLICDNVARFGFAPDPGGGSADDVRLVPIVRVKATLRPGAVRARIARPYRVDAASGTRIVPGWQPFRLP